MSNLILLTVEPHIELYVKHWYGSRLILSDDNTLTSLLKSILRPFEKTSPHRIRPCAKYDLGGWIEIYISDGLLRKYGGYISDHDIKAFSRVIDLMIKQEMYRWCQHPNSTDKMVDFNIRRFIEYYGFNEDDLTFDNLKRWYYRDRERREKRKSIQLKEVILTIPLALKLKPSDILQISLF